MWRAAFSPLAPVLCVLALPALLLACAGVWLVAPSDRLAEDAAHVVFGNADAIGRSIAAGGLACSIAALLGAGPAWFLSRASQTAFGAYGFAMSVLLPMAVVALLVGAGSFAFLYRDLGGWWLAIHGPDARGFAAVLAAQVLAQAIRYAPLLLWLLVIVAGNVEPARRRYGRQVAMTGAQWARVELAARWTPAILVVLAFAYQDAANDFLVTQLALRPSVATASELVGHALEREFTLLLASRSALQAMGVTIISAAVAAVCLALGFLIVVLVALALLRRFVALPPTDSGPGVADRAAAPLLAMIVPALALAAVALLAGRLRPAVAADALATLLPTLAVAAASAVASWAVAALCAYRLRDRPREGRGTVMRDFRLASGLAIAVGFIPPLGLATAVFCIGYSLDADGSRSGWAWLVAAETCRFTPVVFVLLGPAVLAIRDDTIDYLRSIGCSFRERLALAFLQPSATMHGAVLLITFNMVLNEGVIAAVFQADIPSLADLMRRATTGRSANYGLAGVLVGLQLVLFGGLLLLWGRRVRAQWWSGRDAD